MKKVFISYVKENIELVKSLYQELKSHGIEVWLDRKDLAPGLRWKREIRRAIQHGAFFIACFSKEYYARDKTYMNEELTIAIDELRQRPVDQAWFIPVKLNECEIPDRDIGGGETLRDLQYVNLNEDWDVNIERIREIVKPAPSETVNADSVEPSVALNAAAEFFKGLTYQNRRIYEKAVAHYTEALKLNPKLVEAFINRGNTYSSRGEHDRAIEDFTKAIELKPDYTEAYYNRGNAYREQGDFDQAIGEYTKAIELKPNYADAYHNRGFTYWEQRDYDHAIADYTKTIELNPNYTEAYINRGNAYREQGDHDHVIADSTKAIQLNPNHTEAYINRGSGYGGKGDYDRAISDFTKAIQLKPDYAKAYYNRGVVYCGKGDYNRAIPDFNKAIQLKPNFFEVYSNRGAAYGQQGDFYRAFADFNKAITLKPNYADAYSNRGVTYWIMGDFDRAVGDYTTAIQLKPGYTQAYYNRGLTYRELGDFNRAIEDYTKVIEFKPDDAYAYYYRGEIWLRRQKWEKAKSDLLTAREKGLDIVASFRNDYESVSDFERSNRVIVPGDIADMLTQRRRRRYPKTEKFLTAHGTRNQSSDVLKLLAKLRDTGMPLSEYIRMRPTFGLKTGRGEAFVVDGGTRDQLIAEHASSVDILKPFLHGRDIRRWRVARPDAWLIFTYRGIEINRYPAIQRHLERYKDSLSKRAGKQEWYELPAAKNDAARFTQTKLICPNSYDRQTFAVDTDGYYCGDSCYLIPTEETWLCGLLNSSVVEWFYSQVSKQLTGDYLRARSRYMQEIPVPDLTPTQKSLIGKIVDYLIYLQGQPTTSGKDLAHARDFIMLGYFERIVDGLVYESYLKEELHQGGKHFFKPLLDEGLPQIEEIRGDEMPALREIFERLYEKTHPVRSNLFFLDSVKPIRIIEGKA